MIMFVTLLHIAELGDSAFAAVTMGLQDDLGYTASSFTAHPAERSPDSPLRSCLSTLKISAIYLLYWFPK